MVQTDKQSLLKNAFEILLENLGPEKTAQLWQILTPLKGDYLQLRKKLFQGKKLSSLYQEAKRFNKI